MKITRLLRLYTLGVLLPVAAFSLVNGCAQAQTVTQAPDQSAATAPPKMPDKTIDDTDNGKTVSLQVGQRLLVRLPGNPTTGYEWSVGKTDEKLLAPDGETEFDVPATEKAGAPTVQTLFFKAKSIGKVAIELYYTRPWEKDKPPENIYKFNVDIVK